jgi:hypothetical protein
VARGSASPRVSAEARWVDLAHGRFGGPGLRSSRGLIGPVSHSWLAVSSRSPGPVAASHGRTIAGIRVPHISSRPFLALAAGLIPVAVAAAWVPVRGDLPNTDVALLLVLCAGAAATVGGRWAYVIGAVAGAAAFDFFDTPPYGQLYMTRARDVVTTVVLVAVGLLVGELCVRLRSYRLMADRREGDFTVMSSAARLIAVGEDTSMVVEALAGELVSRLGLADCDFEYGPLVDDRPYVGRDGSLVNFETRSSDGSWAEIDLPVWAGTEVVGRYRMYLSSGSPPSTDRLLAAVGIAEQAGAALAAGPPVPQPTPARTRRLRLVR